MRSGIKSAVPQNGGIAWSECLLVKYGLRTALARMSANIKLAALQVLTGLSDSCQKCKYS